MPVRVQALSQWRLSSALAASDSEETLHALCAQHPCCLVGLTTADTSVCGRESPSLIGKSTSKAEARQRKRPKAKHKRGNGVPGMRKRGQ